MTGNPLRFLSSATPWRSWAYAATGAVTGAVVLLAFALLTVPAIVLGVFVVGVGAFALPGVVGPPVGAVERRRVRLLGEPPWPSPHPPLEVPVSGRWLRLRLRENATWREFAYALSMATVLWLLDYVAAALPLVAASLLVAPCLYPMLAGPDGMLLFHVRIGSMTEAFLCSGFAALGLVVSAYLVTGLAALRSTVVRALLVDGRESETRLTELVSSSGRVLDSFDAEARRIERDLHDGTQQRLLALSMLLDMARMELGRTAPPVDTLLSNAQEEAGRALTELREIVHGIHPHVLTERGLGMAVTEMVTAHPMPIDVDLDLAERLPPVVESTAYFMTSEALTNIAKHSGAERAWVRGRVIDGHLVLEVGDTGRGGADPSRGSGLRGLADRAAVLGGHVTLSSPPGGPTVLGVRIPCTRTDAE